MQWTRWPLLVSVFASSACQPNFSSSEVKHEFGVTQRTRESMADCHQQAASSIFPVIDSYLKDLATVLFEANPSTFGSFYTPDKFCFTSEKNHVLNAFAIPATGQVKFFTGMIEHAANDAQIAAIMAHELAHVTMAHDGRQVHPKLAKNAEWKALLDEEKAWGDAKMTEYRDIRTRQRELAEEREAKIQAARESFPAELKQRRTVLVERVTTWQQQASQIGGEMEALWDLLGIFYGEFSDLLPQGGPAADEDDDNAATIARLRTDLESLRSEYQSLKQDELAAMPIDMNTEMARIDSELAEAGAKLEALDLARRSFYDRKEALTIAIIGASARYNWTEQEADEVGYELYLRAGFKASEYPWLHERMLGSEVEACMIQIAEIADPTEESLNRGTGTHPKSCWRVFDVRTLEATLHEADYAPFMPNAVKTEVLPGRLDAAKASLQPPQQTADPGSPVSE